MSRRKAREVAFKVLYQVDLVQSDTEEALINLTQDIYLNNKDLEFASRLIEGTLNNLTEIDQKIARFSIDWALDRMGAVDRNLLRMAAFEIIYASEVHPVVAIDEAVELAKKFGDDSSKGFINAILDRIKEELS